MCFQSCPDVNAKELPLAFQACIRLSPGSDFARRVFAVDECSICTARAQEMQKTDSRAYILPICGRIFLLLIPRGFTHFKSRAPSVVWKMRGNGELLAIVCHGEKFSTTRRPL